MRCTGMAHYDIDYSESNERNTLLEEIKNLSDITVRESYSPYKEELFMSIYSDGTISEYSPCKGDVIYAPKGKGYIKVDSRSEKEREGTKDFLELFNYAGFLEDKSLDGIKSAIKVGIDNNILFTLTKEVKGESIFLTVDGLGKGIYRYAIKTNRCEGFQYEEWSVINEA